MVQRIRQHAEIREGVPALQSGVEVKQRSMPMGDLSRLRDHCPAGVSRWGWVVVQLGLFFLASSALLGGMLLVASLVVAPWCKGFAAYWGDGPNRVLLVAAGLLLAAATQAVSGDLAWWGLFNWLPLFWGFWGWQACLNTPAARWRCSGWLVAGTVPVLVTGLESAPIPPSPLP